MTRQDEYFDELLSAYVDHALADDQRQEVERWLAESSDHRRQLEDLLRLIDGLKDLPRYRLAPAASQRILRMIADRSASAATVDPQSVSEELLSVYADGEATAEECAQIESVLLTSQSHRERLTELDSLRHDLQTLPRYELDNAFAERVVQLAQQEIAATADVKQEETAQEVAPTHTTKSSQRRTWRSLGWVAATVAAAVLLAVALQQFQQDRPGDDPGIAHSPPRESIDAPDVLPNEGITVLEAASNPADPTLQLVNNIRQNCGRRMVLVYEILVTPDGVDNAAFANVLRRHSIRMQNTVPVARDQQKELLKERYLANIEIVDSVEPSMDEIDMFLVSCTGLVADDLFFDLKRPPEGIAGFMLNLATIDPDQGVMHRLCEAADLQEGSNEAAEFLVSFAMLSGAARNLGVFGSIGYVEPVLINPVAPRLEPAAGESIDPNSPEPAASIEELQSGEFPCELLFVVRNLQPTTP